MAYWQARLLRNPAKQIKLNLKAAWKKTLSDLERWMAKDLVKAMVHGGMGIQGIKQTEFFKFISSPDGLSQLGIPATEPPKLLKAYLTTAFKVKRKGETLSLEFGNVAALKAATKHPAAGTGHLSISSWMEWVFDKKQVNSGFVPRRKVLGGQKSIRLGTPLGGLMLPKGALGSSGLWRFPEALSNYEDKWISENSGKIQQAIDNKVVELMTKNING
jgi:hypothetical protein